jgi:hypothetical protein
MSSSAEIRFEMGRPPRGSAQNWTPDQRQASAGLRFSGVPAAADTSASVSAEQISQESLQAIRFQGFGLPLFLPAPFMKV